MTREEMRNLIDEGAYRLNQVATFLGCNEERDLIHNAAARLFLASCGERGREKEDNYWKVERPPIDSDDLS